MAFVVSADQPPGGSLGDEWFNPNTNELKKLVASSGTTVTYATINRANTIVGNVTVANISNNTTITTASISQTFSDWITATGGNIFTADGYTYHTFNASSTFAVTMGIGVGPAYNTAQVLLIGGGGGGGLAKVSTISGSIQYYSGGGGGGVSTPGYPALSGNAGIGGGTGGNTVLAGRSANIYTGSGGGGMAISVNFGGAGGSGYVAVRYKVS